MVSEAQKRASSKYRGEKVREYRIRLSRQDSAIADYLDSKQNKQGYLKELIRAV